MSKRKPMPKPRNRLVVAAKFRKAGAHGKSFKATRREDKVSIQRDASLVARQPAFNRYEGGFESPASYQCQAGFQRVLLGIGISECSSLRRSCGPEE